MRQIETIFEKRRSEEEFMRYAGKLVFHFKHDLLCMSVLADIQRRLPELTGYRAAKRIPRTTNLIESFNSHLEGRLKTIKGFESFTHADLWLNGYFLKRRLTPFTDCGKPFTYLNGRASLQQTLRFPSTFAAISKLIMRPI